MAFLRQQTQDYDVIFLDAERSFYCQYWTDLSRCLARAGSVLIIDNVISHADEVQDFIQIVAMDKRFRCSTIPIGAGLLLVVRQ